VVRILASGQQLGCNDLKSYNFFYFNFVVYACNLNSFHISFPVQGEGSQTKSLKLSPSGNNDGAFFFNFMQNGTKAAKVMIPLGPSELAAIKSLVNYALPRVLGFDMQFEK